MSDALKIPTDLLPADGRFGAGPSKIQTSHLDALAATGSTLMGTSHRQYAQGSYDDAATLAEASKKNAVPEDRDAQILWRSLKAMTFARRGDFPSAEQLAREAVALCETTDFKALHGEALMDLGEVLRLEGRTEEATEAVEEALRLFDEKGALASAVGAHELLRKLGRA